MITLRVYVVTAEAKDEKAFSEAEASEEATEAKEEEEGSPAAEAGAEEPKAKQGGSEAGTTGATFTYEQLQAKSENPVTGIDFKRREVNLLSSVSVLSRRYLSTSCVGILFLESILSGLSIQRRVQNCIWDRERSILQVA